MRVDARVVVAVASTVAIALAGCGSGRRHSSPATSTPSPSTTSTANTPTTTTTPGLALDVSEPRWRLPAPVYRTVAVATERGHRIFLFGGHDAAGGTVSNVEQIDPAQGIARAAGSLAAPTHGAAAALLRSRLLVFGGAATTVHDFVQQFNPSSHTASVIARLPAARADLTAAVVGGDTVVLVGGFDGIGPQADVWATTNGRNFRVIARLRQAVRYPALVADGNSVYVFGGLISGGEYNGHFSDLIQRVSLGSPRARIAGRLPTPLAHAMGAVIRGQLLIVGGSTPRGPSAAILRFSHPGGRVVQQGLLPYARTDAAVATIGNSAYLLGGIERRGSVSRPVATVIRLRLTHAG